MCKDMRNTANVQLVLVRLVWYELVVCLVMKVSDKLRNMD